MDNATGRILEGTKMQAGQHQAIEAKENVKLTKENRAMASITYQSLFNMFPKLAGMTGTGKLVEDELIETYRMEVVVIPTNLPIQRIDYPDSVYITLPEKLYATLELVKKLHQKQQPILLVSATVEITEVYSNMLLQEGIPHNTLTAKPPSSLTPGPNLISVPRPAIVVATVTAPSCPASSIIIASRLALLAVKVL